MSALNDLSPLVYSAKILQRLITTESAKWAVLSKHLSYVDDRKHALEAMNMTWTAPLRNIL